MRAKGLGHVGAKDTSEASQGWLEGLFRGGAWSLQGCHGLCKGCYIHIYIYMCAHINIYIYVCVYVCVYVWLYMYAISTLIYFIVYVYICLYTHLYLCIHVYIMYILLLAVLYMVRTYHISDKKLRPPCLADLLSLSEAEGFEDCCFKYFLACLGLRGFELWGLELLGCQCRNYSERLERL